MELLSVREIDVRSAALRRPLIVLGVSVGIINIKDLTDSSFSLEDTGGKKGFMNNIIGQPCPLIAY